MRTALRNRNLFIRAHEAQHGSDFNRIGSGWEDTLTDQFAFLLSADDQSREAVVRHLLGSRAEPVARIDTQIGHKTGCPDLQIQLESGRLLLLEHKVDASLRKRQIERYLEVEDDSGRPGRVALISRRHLSVSEEVLNHERYIRPTHAAHWYWSDVFGWIPRPDGTLGSNWLRHCFREYMELLGLSPSPLVPPWDDLFSAEPETYPIKDAFGRKLSLIRTHLENQGFSIEGDSRYGFLARPPNRDWPFLHLTVGPARARKDLMEPRFSNQVNSAVFQIALVYDSIEAPPDADGRYVRFDPPVTDSNGFTWYPVTPQSMTNKRTRLSIVSDLDQFLKDPALIAERLFSGFVAVEAFLIGD